MLLLTRLNGHPLAVNGDLIKSVESSPDTMLTLITGEKIVVHETLQQVVDAARDWRVAMLREVLAGPADAERVQQAAAAASAAGSSAAHKADPQEPTERHHD